MKARGATLLFGLALTALGMSQAQNQGVKLEHADRLRSFEEDGKLIRVLEGHVLLRQDEAFLRCDRAREIIDDNRVLLTGNVHIYDGKRTLLSRQVEYFGDTRIEIATGDVSLKTEDELINCHRMIYNQNTQTALAMDQVLRLFHPFIPYVTETLWEKLAEQCPVRGLDEPVESAELLVHAAWPQPRDSWEATDVEPAVDVLRAVVRAVRDLRSQHDVPPRKPVEVIVRGTGREADGLRRLRDLAVQMANLADLTIAPDAERPGAAGPERVASYPPF